jgi:hypothetical protein
MTLLEKKIAAETQDFSEKPSNIEEKKLWAPASKNFNITWVIL